jgi:hypothetical protein
VFIREAAGHGGPLTGLLQSGGELGKALRALTARGYRPADLLVIEFCDLSRNGVFQSASASRIGDRIVPAHLLSGRQWVLKWSGSDHGEAEMLAFRDYNLSNPHEDWIRRVFEMAGIDYGRIDYGIGADTLQLWEINLNPTIGPGPGPVPAPFPPALDRIMWEGRNAYIGGVKRALLALDPDAGTERVTLRLDPGLVSSFHAELAMNRRRKATLGLLGGIFHHPLGYPLRLAYSWLWPRR